MAQFAEEDPDRIGPSSAGVRTRPDSDLIATSSPPADAPPSCPPPPSSPPPSAACPALLPGRAPRRSAARPPPPPRHRGRRVRLRHPPPRRQAGQPRRRQSLSDPSRHPRPGSLLDGPRLHHLFLRRDLRRKGLGLGRKLLLRWCEGVPPQYRAFGVNSPNELMRRVLGRRATHHHLSPHPPVRRTHTPPHPPTPQPRRSSRRDCAARLGGKHLAGHDERDGCGQSVGYYLLKQPE